MSNKKKKEYPIAVKTGVSPDRTRIKMVTEEPFYGQILMNMDVKETSDDNMPTACVFWNKAKRRFGMRYDKELFSYLTEPQQKAIYIHEFLHVILGHLTYRGGSAKKGTTPEEHKIWNIAMDLAINSYVENLPDDIIFPHLAERDERIYQKNLELLDKIIEELSEKREDASLTPEAIEGIDKGIEDVKLKKQLLESQRALEKQRKEEQGIPEGLLQLVIPGKGAFAKYPPYLSSEQYYDLIVNDPNMKDKVDKMFSGQGGTEWIFDGHGQSDEQEQETNGFDKVEKEAEARRITSKGASNSAKTNQWGSVSADLSELIETLLTTKVDWRAALRYFVLKSQRGNRYSTFRAVNRRFRNEKGESLAPGRKTHRTSRILVAVDESGSVSNDLMAEFVTELNGLAKHTQFTMLPFDCSVGEPWEWRKGMALASVERTKMGGTDFNAPTEYFNQNKEYDGLIILTDMYAPTPDPVSRGNRIWVTNTDKSTSENVANGETVIYVELSEY